jgi:hypothetical protein
MSEQDCVTLDWRTVGFEDGTQGRPVGTIGNYRQACSKYGVASDLESYRAGHAEGVEVYCRPARGFEVGHRGASYQGVCPAASEPDFLAAYTSGRHLYELESALRRVEGQIASNSRAQEKIKKELTAISAAMVSDETSAEQRVLLVADAAELGHRYGELTAEIEALREERVVSQLALQDYQETLAYGF